MFVIKLLANHDRGCIAGSSKVDDFFGRTFRINRNTAGAGLQNAKVSHAPLRSIVAKEHYSIARLNSFINQESGSTSRELTQIGIGVLFLASIPLDAHCHASRMSFGRSFEEL